MPKLYIPSTIKTQINLVPFCWADWAVRAVLKMSSILFKYPTFEDGLFIFSWASLYCAQLETIWCSESEKYCDSWIEEIKESFKKGCSIDLPVSFCHPIVHATEVLIFYRSFNQLSEAGTGGVQGGHCPSPIFGRAVNPIPTWEGRLSPPITTGTSNVFHLPA